MLVLQIGDRQAALPVDEVLEIESILSPLFQSDPCQGTRLFRGAIWVERSRMPLIDPKALLRILAIRS